MPHSHHSHSGQFCRHAQDTLGHVVLEAIRQGFHLFGLSEHAPRYRIEDLFPEEADLTPADLSTAYTSFLHEAASLRSTHAHAISLLISIETDYITPLDCTNLTSILEEHHEIDYVVGSVHHVNGVSIDFDRPTWLRALGDQTLPELQPSHTPSPETLIPFLSNYFDAQHTLITTHTPEVLGHIDLCSLWTPGLDLKAEGMEGVWEKVERNVRAVVRYGGLFEANAAAIRKGWGTSYPGKDILQLIQELRGKICLSDDSHGVSYVGLNYPKMRDYLTSMGVERIWYLVPASQRKEGDEEVGVRRRVVARPMDGWAEHPFWAKLEAAQADRS
ncbi:histidinol-phosphatase (PHP family) [Cryptococcus wingfieldii CBS 7118]|uniref:Histidinol-phosphatase n=1 Tax=Cryptococcus wingfieldii CBS 7118 TaxID=1295528 RepID=A0A1E3K2Y5_9TREE|nr:histidinol-phosphatase (PHP family) [Cryptococcus wingfieldii CBS 7118]ODO07548.1 histidinol-phosphatase (PHP family) [Cryptococcus wingfieldii CBS 7118]